MELLLLSQFNIGSPLPTFFELVAERTLRSSLEDVFRFVLASLAQRYERLVPAVPFSTEIFYLTWLFVERSSIASGNSTFAESFYGFTRALVVHKATVVDQDGETSPAQPDAAQEVSNAEQAPIAEENFGEGLTLNMDLPTRIKVLTLLQSTLLPYLRQYVAKRHEFLTSDNEDNQVQRRAEEAARPYLVPVNAVVVRYYPVFHVINEGLTLFYYVAYACEKLPYFSPLMHFFNVVLRRMGKEDFAKRASSSSMRMFMLILSTVFIAFRYLEWRNTEAGGGFSQAITADAALPTPPPPTTSSPLVLVEKGHCAVCHRRFVNPAVNVASGFVFCYPCLHQHVASKGTCPASGVPTSIHHIRRLFEN